MQTSLPRVEGGTIQEIFRMRSLALLYYHAVRRKLPGIRRTVERFSNEKQFDRLYRLDRDPFNVKASDYERRKRDQLISMLGTRRYDRILDVGCGTGGMLRALADHGREIVGIDFSAEALRRASKNASDLANVRLIQADLRSFNLGETFDLFVCSEVLYYLTPNELHSASSSFRLHANVGAELISIMRAYDTPVLAHLESSFTLLEKRICEDRLRPYIITRYRV
jgi:SAM-dependent methyltransferase